MTGYYTQKLSAERLRFCYEIASPRVQHSSYAEKFREHRLQWFRRRAEYGLVGEIDENVRFHTFF